jgi:hypothetical protein
MLNQKLKTLLSLFAFFSIIYTKSEGASKASQLREKAYKSKNAVIELNRIEYEYFIEEAPRPYNVVLFLTNHCEFCKYFHHLKQ